MRLAFLVLVSALLLAVPAAAQTTGPTGPLNPLPPGASTVGSAEVTQGTATVRGRVSPNGGETRVQFEYGTSTGYGLTTATQTLPADASGTDVEAALTRLTAATTYHFRVVATNAAGVSRGGDRTFRTASPPAAPSRPAVASVAAKDLAFDAATLQARVDPNRQETSYVFEYGTSTRYGTRTGAVGVGAGDTGVPVSARVGGLAANKKYFFRLRATNASGTTVGGSRSFTTAKVALGLTARASTTIVRYSRPLVITGTVTGTDRNRVPVQLERRNFPFATGFTAVGNQLLTDANGLVTFPIAPFTLATQFRLLAPSRGGLASNVAGVRVRALVRLRVRRLSGGRLRLSGTVAPANARGRVSIQRRGSSGRYAAVKRVTLRSTKGVARFTTVVRTRATPSVYRAATRLSGGELVDGRSPIIRVRGGR